MRIYLPSTPPGGAGHRYRARGCIICSRSLSGLPYGRSQNTHCARRAAIDGHEPTGPHPGADHGGYSQAFATHSPRRWLRSCGHLRGLVLRADRCMTGDRTWARKKVRDRDPVPPLSGTVGRHRRTAPCDRVHVPSGTSPGRSIHPHPGRDRNTPPPRRTSRHG